MPIVYTGPLLDTRPARFTPPKNSCDCHAHIFGPKAKFPYPNPGAKDEYPDAPYEAYMKMHETIGIDRGVLTQSSRYGTDNSALLDALERANGALRGIVAAHVPDITDKFIAEMDPKGVRGIRIHQEEFDDLEEVSARIADAGWRVEIVPPSAEAVVALRPKFAKMKCDVLVDQMSRPKVSEGIDGPAFKQIREMVRDGMWIKLSHAYHVTDAGPPYADALPFAQALVQANADRCLWGTDWPHPQKKWETPNDGLLLDLLADWVPDEKVRNRILVDNPEKLNRF